MKALTQQELQQFVVCVAAVLDGAQLQEIITNDRGLALGFQGDRRYWLILDLVPSSPMLLLFESHCPFRKGTKPKPLGLFLNANAKNFYLTGMHVQEELGRVVKIALKNVQVDCELELRLIPKQCNLIVKAQGKQISWEKPVDLSAVPHVVNPPAPRTIEEIKEEWLKEQKGDSKPSLDPASQWEKQKNKDLEKKRKALGEIQKQIESDRGEIWSEAGFYLKIHGSLHVPEHLCSCVDVKQSLSWNIENCFRKSKQQSAKKEGARERYAELLQGIVTLEKSHYSAKVAAKSNAPDLMRKAEARGRKLNLPSGALAYCGKSAADNLALLRQAKSWDYWLHLRDYPGAHAIVHRKREQVIGDAEIQLVAEWVVKESLASRSLRLGQKVAVVIVECRFVRPIKGDKLGRVTYHSEKSLSFILK